MGGALTTEQRSRCMAAIRSKNTKPEITVRKIAWSLGFRYRVHDRKLPGSPDIVFPKLKRVILVHGCFWHRHSCRAGRVIPRVNPAYWTKKFHRNIERDAENRLKLRKKGWQYLVIWECQIKNREKLIGRIADFLQGSSPKRFAGGIIGSAKVREGKGTRRKRAAGIENTMMVSIKKAR